MNFSHLLAFKAVAEAGHFGRGAASLKVSQPAVTKQVAILEQSLGVMLIDRSNRRRIQLTHAGAALLPYACRIFALAEEAQRVIQDTSALRTGQIRVGATPTLGTYFLPKILVYYKQRFPGISMTVEVVAARVLIRQLLDGDLDVALMTGQQHDAISDLQSKQFMRLPVASVVAKSLAVTLGKSPLLRNLATLPWVVRESSACVTSSLQRVFSKQGLSLSPSMRLSTTEAVKQAVIAGLGVAALPEVSIRNELARGQLVALPTRELKLHQAAYWVTPRSAEASKPVRALWCIVEHAARGTLPPPRRLAAFTSDAAVSH